MTNAGKPPNEPVKFQYGLPFSHTFTVESSADGNPGTFKAWRHPSAALDLDVSVTLVESVELGAGWLDIVVSLSAAQTQLDYARGSWSVQDDADDDILIHGDLIIQSIPYS